MEGNIQTITQKYTRWYAMTKDYKSVNDVINNSFNYLFIKYQLMKSAKPIISTTELVDQRHSDKPTHEQQCEVRNLHKQTNEIYEKTVAIKYCTAQTDYDHKWSE